MIEAYSQSSTELRAIPLRLRHYALSLAKQYH